MSIFPPKTYYPSGYSTINCITNYTTIGKYCKLINCLAWWRLMSPIAPVVPFSILLATVFFKKHNSFKKSRVGCNWCVLCRRIKRESILSLCGPWTLFKKCNQNPIQKTHWLWDERTGSAQMLTRFGFLPTKWHHSSTTLLSDPQTHFMRKVNVHVIISPEVSSELHVFLLSHANYLLHLWLW